MEYEFTKDEYKKVGAYLLYELAMEQALSESAARKIHAVAMLTESDETADEMFSLGVLSEAQGETVPMKIGFDGNNITISHGFVGNERVLAIPPATVKQVWQDARYQTAEQILVAFGVPNDEVQARSKGGYINGRVSKIADIYNQRYVPTAPKEYKLSKVGQRAKAYWSGRSPTQDESYDYEDPNPENINRGQRGRRDPLVQRINQQEIMVGTFYRDVTRISKSTTARWIRLWRKSIRAVQPNRRGILGMLIGRTWKKTFILGYQLNRTLFFEVWYNSMDSSFSVYDKNGIELTHPIPTLQESIKMLIRTIAQESPGDRDIFASGRAGIEMASSLGRVLGTAADRDIKQIRREDEFLRNEIRREEKERQDRTAQRQPKDRPKSIFGPADYSNVEKAQRVAANVQTAVTPAASASKSAIQQAIKDATGAARAAVMAAAVATSDVQPKAAQANRVTSQQPQTRASVASAQAAMDDLQVQEYRSSLIGIMSRLSDEQGKLQGISEDPEAIRDISVDPTLAQIFNGMTDEADIARMAARAEKALIAERNYINSLMELGDIDFSSEIQKKIRSEGRDYGKSTATMMNLVVRRLRSRNSGMFESAIEEMAQWREVNSDYREAIAGFDAERRQKIDQVQAQNSQDSFDPNAVLSGLDRDREAQRVRAQVRNSGYNKQMLISNISDSIEAYDITRIRQAQMKSTFANWWGRLARGRTAPIQSPMIQQSFFSRVKQAFFDQERRADFVIGYSLNNIVNLEVWYITEVDPSRNGRMISSFYVYDVTAEKIIRSHLPYFRNAAQVIAAKIGVSNRGL